MEVEVGKVGSASILQMHFIRRRLINGLICLAVFFCAASVFAKEDWEYWSEYEFNIKLSEKTTFKIAPNLQFRDDMSKFYHSEIELGIDYELCKNLVISPGYHYEYEEDEEGKNTDENRIYLDGTIKWSWLGFKFSDRNKGEYRNVSGDEFWRYRNKFKIKRPLKFFSITPFIANEIFYDTRPDEFNKNRFQLGLSKELTKVMCLEIYYILESNKKNGHWQDEKKILGTCLIMNF